MPRDSLSSRSDTGDVMGDIERELDDALAAIAKIEAAQLDGRLPTWVVRDLRPARSALSQLEGAVEALRRISEDRGTPNSPLDYLRIKTIAREFVESLDGPGGR